MNEQEMKQWIDNASYQDLLEKWRFAGSGEPLFQGEVGQYYSKVMREKGTALGPAGVTLASKSIGW